MRWKAITLYVAALSVFCAIHYSDSWAVPGAPPDSQNSTSPNCDPDALPGLPNDDDLRVFSKNHMLSKNVALQQSIWMAIIAFLETNFRCVNSEYVSKLRRHISGLARSESCSPELAAPLVQLCSDLNQLIALKKEISATLGIMIPDVEDSFTSKGNYMLSVVGNMLNYLNLPRLIAFVELLEDWVSEMPSTLACGKNQLLALIDDIYEFIDLVEDLRLGIEDIEKVYAGLLEHLSDITSAGDFPNLDRAMRRAEVTRQAKDTK
ncbi:MAG: hypothetical protein LBS14_03500 [Holosporaceae bacterium]|jgi:hypothetical protein|nr:hypothetical protein [Holosporaceae bacterium]